MKLYKFEIEETIDSTKYRFNGYGNTPEQAVEAMDELMMASDKQSEKVVRQEERAMKRLGTHEKKLV